MPEDEKWSRIETTPIIITVLLSLVSIFVAWISSQRGWVIWLTVSVGALIIKEQIETGALRELISNRRALRLN